MDTHGYPQKICGYGYGYGCEISYPRQPWLATTMLGRQAVKSLGGLSPQAPEGHRHMVMQAHR